MRAALVVPAALGIVLGGLGSWWKAAAPCWVPGGILPVRLLWVPRPGRPGARWARGGATIGFAMTTARTVPVTTEMDGDELDALDAWHLARRHGLSRIAVESFVRFRYGDGFTNSRALALQACLAVVPFLLALTGLAADIDEERPAEVVAHVVDSLSPGAGDSDALTSAVEKSDESERGRRGGAGAGARVRPGLDDDRDGPGRAGRQPDLRHPARPDGAGQVRPGRGPHRGAGRSGRHRVPDDRRRRRLRRGDGRQLRLVRRRPCSGGTSCAGRWGSASSCSPSPCCSTTRRGAASRRCPGWRWARGSRSRSARSPRSDWPSTSR